MRYHDASGIFPSVLYKRHHEIKAICQSVLSKGHHEFEEINTLCFFYISQNMDPCTFYGTKRTKTRISVTNGVEIVKNNFIVEEIPDDCSEAGEDHDSDSGEDEPYLLVRR